MTSGSAAVGTLFLHLPTRAWGPHLPSLSETLMVWEPACWGGELGAGCGLGTALSEPGLWLNLPNLRGPARWLT